MKSTLICKLDQIPIQKALYGGKVKPPCGAKSYDLVKIAKENGNKTDIITFRDKAKNGDLGKILRRYIIKKERFGETVTQRNYFQINNKKFIIPELSSNKFDLQSIGRKISSVTKFEGEYFGKSTEIQTVTFRNDDTPVVHISKLDSQPFGEGYIEDETQSLYQYIKGKPKKGYEIKTCLKSRLGYFDDIISPSFEFIGFSDKLVKQFKNDIYFPLHLYSFKDFKKFAPTIARHPKHQTELPFDIYWFSDSRAHKYGFFDGDINLNTRALASRFHIINTSAHEKEHAYQLEQCVFEALKSGILKAPKYVSQDLYEKYMKYYTSGGKCKIKDKHELKLIKQDYENYIKSDENNSAYRDQFVEMSARVAGGLAEQAYRKSARTLKQEFKYAPDYLIGYSLRDKLLRAWNILHTS